MTDLTIKADLTDKARLVIEAFQAKGLMLACAESCTGGLVAASLTAIAGSSAVVERGFVTYSNQSKTEMLGIPAALIARHGAVSEAVARAMAQGAVAASRADVAVAITGIAGPGGGGAEKPVGLVHLAATRRGGVMLHRREIFTGDRDAVRAQAVLVALEMAIALVAA